MEKDEQVIMESAQVFFNKQMPIHIQKWDGGWQNGYIKELGTNFIILSEFVDGDIVVFAREMKSMDSFSDKKKKRENGRN